MYDSIDIAQLFSSKSIMKHSCCGTEPLVIEALFWNTDGIENSQHWT